MGIFSGALLEVLNKDRVGERFYCNVKLDVQGVIFYGHQFLLGSTSGYFERVFRSRFKENLTDVIVISGPLIYEITPQTMELVLVYIYTETIILEHENIVPIAMAADYLDVKQLMSVCISFLKDSITSHTWLDTLRIADQLSLESVKLTCFQLFPSLCGDIDFAPFSSAEFESTIELLHNEMTPDSVFKAVISWISDDENDRKKYFAGFVNKYTRFEKMEISFILDHVMDEKSSEDF